jgi:hypothetical protein
MGGAGWIEVSGDRYALTAAGKAKRTELMPARAKSQV